MIKFKMMIMLYRHVTLCTICARGESTSQFMFFVLYFDDSTELYGFVQVICCYTSTRNTADKDLNVGGGQKHPHLLKKTKTKNRQTKNTRLEYRNKQPGSADYSVVWILVIFMLSDVNPLFYQA